MIHLCRSSRNVLSIPWYKGMLERFQGTMNHDLIQGNPGSTFSNILDRDNYNPNQHAVVTSTFAY
jgi:hypothetical protein